MYMKYGIYMDLNGGYGHERIMRFEFYCALLGENILHSIENLVLCCLIYLYRHNLLQMLRKLVDRYV